MEPTFWPKMYIDGEVKSPDSGVNYVVEVNTWYPWSRVESAARGSHETETRLVGFSASGDKIGGEVQRRIDLVSQSIQPGARFVVRAKVRASGASSERRHELVEVAA